jgi:EAL domain-containing protein (putative c-di-GMP-specific phosphodiesterase class I)
MVPIAVNLSVLQLIHIDFAERFVQTLEYFGVNRQWIHLEVTETAAMRNLSEVTAQMAALSALGITFSLDAFGTGHSSLGRLHQLNLSVLKIDRSFISDLAREKGTFSIVQAIVSMAHSLGHIVVAEGIETEDQLACLRELNCDLLQGYLLSRPVRPEQITAQMTVPHAKIVHPLKLPASADLAVSRRCASHCLCRASSQYRLNVIKGRALLPVRLRCTSGHGRD